MAEASGTTEDEMIPILVERIVSRFDPLKIILFGSRGRGDARPDSDYDLLVVMPEGTPEHQVASSIVTDLSRLRVPADVVVSTPAVLAQHGDSVAWVYRPALREGRVVYERA